MRTAKLCAILGVAAAMASAVPALHASVISFDPDGNLGSLPAVQVASFDLLPGSSLDQGIIAVPNVPPVVGATTAVYFQARLGSLLDSNGGVISTPGLNDPAAAHPFQITVTAQFNATITTETAGTTPTTILSLTSGVPNFVKFYYNGALTANDLTGAGFTDGTLIAQGTASTVTSVFTTVTALGTQLFDQFGPDNYGGKSSIVGIGGTAFSAGGLTLNSAWFQTPGISTLMGNTTDALAYNQANPSQTFFGTTPNLGSTNGQTGPDVELQTDGVTSFVVVPEPASLLLLAAGAGTLLSRRRR